MAATSKSHHFILVLCGGTGPRLWPLSRASNPKQFLNLFGQHSLLQQTILRAQKIVPKDHVFVVTNQRYLPQVNQQTSRLIPPANIIPEPEKKNTLQAISYAVAIIRKFDPEAVITSMPSDHFIHHTPIFVRQIKQASSLASTSNSFVLIGITPSNPNTSYGYFQVIQKPGKDFVKISNFVEKPDSTLAAKLVKSKALWNSGIYTFSISTFLSELQKHQPAYYQINQKIFDNLNHPQIIKKLYHLADNLAIDVGLSQKSNNLIGIKSKFVWSDVGEWKTIFAQLKKDKNQNAVLDKNTQFLSYNSRNCLVHGDSNKMIGLVGVQNLAVIDTPDGLLICDLQSSFNVRDLITLIVKSKNTEKYFLS